MKAFFAFLLFFKVTLNFVQLQAQPGSICNNGGNVVIFSNYDGGFLNINVDQNIPNLKVGITTYEKTRVTFSGPFVGNIVQVVYAGYNGQNNHCSPSPSNTSINGVPSNITTIYTSNNIQAATKQNPSGYPFIICNYSCDSASYQGGCNTPDQIVDYYLTLFGGTLYSHFTQYGCWSGTYNISSGGNCCIGSPVVNCSLPAAASVITGRSAICEGETNVSYSISPSAGATGYDWTVPAGAGIVSGVNTNTVTVQFPQGSQSGVVTVVPKNNCGNGTSSSLAVAVQSAVSAGTIAASPNTICKGETALLSLTAANDTIQWQSSTDNINFQNLAGIDDTSYVAAPTQDSYYRIVVQNGVCRDTSPVYLLTVHPLPAAPLLTATDTVICSGDSTLICAPATYNQYQWNSGDTSACIYAKAAGAYFLTVSDITGCANQSGRVNIAVNPVPSVSITVRGDTLSSFNATSYQWLLDGVEIPSANSQVFVAGQPGSYTLRITDVNGCVAISSPVLITGQTNLSEDWIRVYPNPSSADALQLLVDGNFIGGTADIYDAAGVHIQSFHIENAHSIIRPKASSGIYFLRFGNGNMNVVKRWVKL